MEFIIKRNGTIKGGEIIINKKTGELKVIQNKKKYFIKNLVYEKFSGEKISDDETIIHIDGDKENNSFDNLKCLNKNYQKTDKMRQMRIKKSEKVGEHEVLRCDGQTFTSRYALSKHLECSAGLISLIISRKAKNKRHTFTQIVDNVETVFKLE
jgi:hypothetical protein